MKPRKHNIIYESFRELFIASKSMFVLSYTLTLFQGISRVLPIIAIQQLFDHLYLVKQENGTIKVAIYIGAYTGARCLCHVMDLLSNYFYEKYNLIAAYGMTKKLNEKIGYKEALRFEEPSFLDDVTKAYRGTKSIRRFIDTWMMIGMLYLPQIITIAVYLVSASPFLLLILIVVLIPEIVIMKLQERKSAAQEEQIAVLQRKREVLEGNAFHLRSNIESRVLGYLPLLVGKIKELIYKTASLDYQYQEKKNQLENIEKIVLMIGHIAIFGILLYCTLCNVITIGVFSALITSLDDLFELMENILSVIVEGVSEELEKIRNYLKQLSVLEHADASQEDIKIDHVETIEFRNVSFMYPGQKEKAIKDLSLTVNDGELIAIVGENGSGKSTFLKLLSGIYCSTEGEIFVNGTDVRKIHKASLHKCFTAVFQNYGKYALTLNANIILNQEESDNKLHEVKNMRGLDEIDKIDGNTVLSREFGGIDLSGGQWQRVAIARCCYRDKQIKLLDEPTSAIDPNEEKTLYNLFGQIMKGKTSLIVTHRMGATKLANRILVFDHGELVGDGSHKVLMECCDKYRTLWNSQAGAYQE